MLAFDIINQSIPSIEEFLAPHGAELRKTKYPNTYLVKFSPDANVTHPVINRLKGLIFNHITRKIYSLTYPVPLEVKDLSIEKQEQLVAELDSSVYEVQEALDGTLFRYSFIDEVNEWQLSTNSKEDANTAFWMNGISLGKQFESIKNVKIDTSNFDKNHVHLFVMCHPLNVIVVNHEESKLYHVSTYDRTTMTEIECDIGLPKPQKYDLTPSEVKSKTMETLTKPVESAGYMVLVRDENICRRYRFENANYTEAKNLRGNSNNIEYTLLEILIEKGETNVTQFLLYYPIYAGEYLAMLQRIAKLSAKLYREYGLRYKDHRDIFVHPRHHKFLGEIHQKVFKDTLKPIRKTVQYEDIRKFLIRQPPAKLLYLLNYIHDHVGTK